MAIRCLVIMPFDDGYDDVFEVGIKATLEARGIVCERMDKIAGSMNIVSEMVRRLYEADLIVADLSECNANVHYELGVSHAAGGARHWTLIAEHGTKVAFDLAQYKVLFYRRTYKGIHNLVSELSLEIDALGNSDGPVNPVHDYLQGVRAHVGRKPSRPKLTDRQPERQLRDAAVQMLVLRSLAALPADAPAPALTGLCRSLNLSSRKTAVEAVRFLEESELIERAAENKGTCWRATNKGRRLSASLASLAGVS
jgi:predicted transcriptional regulator